MLNETSFIAVFNKYLIESIASDPRMKKETFEDYVRYTGPSKTYYDSTLYSPNLDCSSEERLHSLIEEQIQYFNSLGKNFEWKVYDFNNLQKLEELLIQKGFIVRRKSTVMYAPIEMHVPVKNSFQIVKAKVWDDFKHIVDIQEDVYGKGSGDFVKELMQEALQTQSRLDVFIALKESKALSAAWIRHYGSISFFFGGATLKEARTCGAYSALVKERIDCAKKREAQFVVSECSPDSEAVLNKVGFKKAGNVIVYVFERF